MATKQAKLTILTFAQDFQSGHWNWTDGEKKKLGDVEEMGKSILNITVKSMNHGQRAELKSV